MVPVISSRSRSSPRCRSGGYGKASRTCLIKAGCRWCSTPQATERPDPHGSVRRARHEAIGVVGESKEQDSAGVPDQVSRESVAYNITYIDVADAGADRHTCTWHVDGDGAGPARGIGKLTE